MTINRTIQYKATINGSENAVIHIGGMEYSVPISSVMNIPAIAATFASVTTSGPISANGGGTLGDASGDTVVIKGTTVNSFSSALLDNTSASDWRSDIGLANAFTNVVRRTFTSSGTYTPTSGMVYCVVEAVGGGGAGGSVDGSAGSVTAAGGGASGSYSVLRFTAADIGASQTVTIGAGGTPGAAGANVGGNGGTTSLGSLLLAGGGGGGQPSTGSGNVGRGGDPSGTGSFVGNAGGAGFVSIGVAAYTYSGAGAGSYFGGGTRGTYAAAAFNAPANTGGGGCGAHSNDATDRAGGAGGSGILIITEFIKA